MKPNLFWVFKLAFWLIAILIFLLLFVYPLLTGWLINTGQMPIGMSRIFEPIEMAQTWLMRIFGLAWIFFLGSCFASFLNVVAWRVPRGGSINGSSHCPDCDQHLKFRDNTPIIGWLRCGGKCSNCKLEIPIRYLIVEVILGSVFLLVASVELLTGGWNLPFRAVESLQGFEHLIFDPNWELIFTTGYHLALLCVLFTFALIRTESLKVPYPVWITGLVIGVAVPLFWPKVNLVTWQFTPASVGGSFSFDQFAVLLIGLTAGAVAGGLFRCWKKFEPEHPHVFQPTFISIEVGAFTLIGLFLGWQSVISIGLVVALTLLVLRFIRGTSIQLWSGGFIFVSTLLHLIFWRTTTEFGFWPSGKAEWPTLVISVLLLAFLAFAATNTTNAKHA